MSVSDNTLSNKIHMVLTFMSLQFSRKNKRIKMCWAFWQTLYRSYLVRLSHIRTSWFKLRRSGKSSLKEMVSPEEWKSIGWLQSSTASRAWSLRERNRTLENAKRKIQRSTRTLKSPNIGRSSRSEGEIYLERLKDQVLKSFGFF